MSDTLSLPAVISVPSVPLAHSRTIPHLVSSLGPAAAFAWDEFFMAYLRNPHTRTAYRRAVRRFLRWVEPHNVELPQVTPGMVGAYFDQFVGSPPTKKLHLAALRAFFDLLTKRHVMLLNPAASVRGERYQVVEGKTPEISAVHARRLLESIDIGSIVGLRDRAVIGCLIYTAARAGSIARLQMKDFVDDGTQYVLGFVEKGTKLREIPVRHDLQRFLLEYLRLAGLSEEPKDSPLFRTAVGKSDLLTRRAMTGIDICRMLKRRFKNAGLASRLSPHSFRVCTITDLLTQGVPLEDVQFLAGHGDPRTTRLYDRRQRKVTRSIVERISI